MKQSKAIDVAAYLAVQDCKKYGIPTFVNPPPYIAGASISDHAYVTKVLKDGTHTAKAVTVPKGLKKVTIGHQWKKGDATLTSLRAIYSYKKLV